MLSDALSPVQTKNYFMFLKNILKGKSDRKMTSVSKRIRHLKEVILMDEGLLTLELASFILLVIFIFSHGEKTENVLLTKKLVSF